MTNKTPSPFLPQVVNFPEEPERFKSFFTVLLTNYANVINDKKSGVITAVENYSGETWGYLSTKKIRNGYQVVRYFPDMISQVVSLPIDDVQPQFVVTNVWGSATKPCTAVLAGDGDYFSFNARGDPRITFDMSDLQLTITSALVGYTGFIVIEYLRDGV